MFLKKISRVTLFLLELQVDHISKLWKVESSRDKNQLRLVFAGELNVVWMIFFLDLKRAAIFSKKWVFYVIIIWFLHDSFLIVAFPRITSYISTEISILEVCWCKTCAVISKSFNSSDETPPYQIDEIW